VFGFPPPSHAAAGWQINDHALGLEREYGLKYASDTRGGPPFLPMLGTTVSSCPQLPTTLPTFDELLGLDGVGESTVAEKVYRLAAAASAFSTSADGTAPAAPALDLQVFTLHAELEGMRLLDAFESLLVKWCESGAELTRMATIREHAMQRPLPHLTVVMGEVPGRSGQLAVQAPPLATSA